MNDPIERYYEEFETRYEAVARPAERSVRRFPVRRVAIAGAVAGLALGVGFATLPGSDPQSGSAYAVERIKEVLDPNGFIVHYRLIDRGQESSTKDSPAVLNKSDSEMWFVSNSQYRTRMRVTPLKPSDAEQQFTVDASIGDGKLRTWASGDRVITQQTAPDALSGGALSADPIAQARTLLDDGRMVDAGEVTRDGRRLRKLVASPDAERQLGRLVLYADASTFEPVELRLLGTISEVRDFERLPLNEENLKLLDIDAPPGARVVTQD